MKSILTEEQRRKGAESTRRLWKERREAINADANKAHFAKKAEKEADRIPATVIRWVADQLRPPKEGEPQKDAKPPSRYAANLLAKCRSSEKMELMFWGKLIDMEKAEEIKKTEAKKMEDDQRESFSLIEMWKREMPGYLERKALHDAAQAQEAEKRRNRAQRLAEFQSGGGGETQTQPEAESPATPAAPREDGGGEVAEATVGERRPSGAECSPAESREEARAETESRAESEAVAV